MVAAESSGIEAPDPGHNIPPARTELIGRTELLDVACLAIGAARLVTLVGLGGAGKTTLAHEVGRRSVEDFPDGVWFADLIPVHDADGLDAAVARAIGLQLGPGADRADLLARLADRHLLLVLDNCEHVLDHAAAFAEQLLDSAGRVRTLATSREPLRVVGERRLQVGPLPVVADDGGAVDLLELVARRYGAEIPESDRVAAIELCTRIDGLPLAIELVGARLPILSVGEVIERLDLGQDPDTGERRPDRHAGLATILARTIGGLAPHEARLLTALCRIEGGFGIADAEVLGPHVGANDAAGALGALTDRSLITTSTDTPRRHSVLETVRQHCEARDPDPAGTRDAHAQWCLDSVGTTLDEHFYDLGKSVWFTEHHADLLAAEKHLSETGRHDDAAAIVASTGLAMHLDDGSRAAVMLGLVDTHAPRVTDPVLAARLGCTGVMAAMAARVPRGMLDHGQRAVTAADRTDDPSLQALARVMRSWAGVIVDPAQAMDDIDTAIGLADSVGDDATVLMATGYKVLNLAMAIRFDEAVEIGYEALEREVSPMSYPRRVVSTGLICSLVLDDPAAALRIDDAVRAGVRSAGFWGTSIVRGVSLASLGLIDSVLALTRDLQARLGRAGVSPLPDVLLVAASLAHTLGESARAGRYLGAVRASAEPTQSLMTSTAYRAMRCHIELADPDDVEASTADIWSEAERWMNGLATRP